MSKQEYDPEDSMLKGVNLNSHSFPKIPQPITLDPSWEYVGLSFKYGDISYGNLKTLFDAIKVHTNLEGFMIDHIYEQQQYDNVMKLLPDTLKHNTKLCFIDFAECELKDSQLDRLFEVLQNSKTLTTITLWHNDISSDGVKIITDYLKQNDQSKLINLNHNNIGDDGIKEFARALKAKEISLGLCVQACGITTKGIEYIAEALRANVELSDLSIGGNNLDITDVKIILEALQTNTNLTRLDFSKSSISDEISWIIDLIKNTHLTEFYLHDNNVSKEVLNQIAEILEQNKLKLPSENVEELNSEDGLNEQSLTSPSESIDEIDVSGNVDDVQEVIWSICPSLCVLL